MYMSKANVLPIAFNSYLQGTFKGRGHRGVALLLHVRETGLFLRYAYSEEEGAAHLTFTPSGV